MRKFLVLGMASFLSSSVSAHAGLYHTLVEKPLSIWPAVAVTAAFVLVVFGLEKLRKKKEV